MRGRIRGRGPGDRRLQRLQPQPAVLSICKVSKVCAERQSLTPCLRLEAVAKLVAHLDRGSHTESIPTRAGGQGFRAYVEFVDDADWYETASDRLRDSLPEYNRKIHSVLFAADERTLATEDFPIVVIDLVSRKPDFRCIASELWAVENNLNIANVGWEDFTAAVDEGGIYRGFR